jgi:uncharacterized protein
MRPMRFLQLVFARSGIPARPRDPEHAAKVGNTIRAAIAAGRVVATGGLGKRATAAARVMNRGGEIVVEDPPTGDGWMAAGGYSLIQFATKDEAIANARATLELMGDADIELIQVSEMHPPANAANTPHYVEVVTSEVEQVRDTYAAIHGIAFEQVAALGNAFVSLLPNGSRLGVRAPMHAGEKPVTRVYLRVADLDAATRVAETRGAHIAVPPMDIPGHGRIALYILGGTEQGLWQL